MRLPFNTAYPTTQPFGVNPQDYAQFGMKGHNGIDYGLPTGTQVVAATAGTVAVLSDPGGFGNYIQITGADYRTIYAHLQRAVVPNGAVVAEGQLIGLSDNTGNSSGPHLHFGVKPIKGLDNNNGFFGAIDPLPILNQEDDMKLTPGDIDKVIKMGLRREPTAEELGNQAYADDATLLINTVWNNGGEQFYTNPPAPPEAKDLKPGLYKVT